MDLRVIENRCMLYMYSTRLSVRVDFVAKGCVCKRNKRKAIRVGGL